MAIKLCCRCGDLKRIHDFHVDSRKKDGRRAYCGTCGSKYARERYVKSKTSNPIGISKTRSNNRADYLLRYNYGITKEEYDRLFVKQGGTCAICKEPPKGKDFGVDHCHSTQKVRGLLCGKCNKGIGMFKDDKELLLNAIEYLDS